MFQLRSAEQAILEEPVFELIPLQRAISIFIQEIGSQIQIGLQWIDKRIDKRIAIAFLKPAFVFAPIRLAEGKVKQIAIERPYFELQLDYEKSMTILPSEEYFKRETLTKGQRGEFRNLLRTINGGKFLYFILGEIEESGVSVVQSVNMKEYLPIEVENIPPEVNHLYLFLSQSDKKLQDLFKSIEEIIKTSKEVKEKTLDMENIILIKITMRR